MGKGRIGAGLIACAFIIACVAAPRDAVRSEAGLSRTSTDELAAIMSDLDYSERVELSARSLARTDEDAARWSAVPAAADEAGALLEQLVSVEHAVRDPSVSGAKLAYMGHLQQLVYMRLIERPDLRDPVFSAIPKDLRAAADLNLAASANLWLFGPTIVTELPEWRIVPAAPLDRLLAYYREAEAKFSVPWYYLAAINLVETRMGRIRGESWAGARGPMQFMPATWDAYGEGDINDPRDAILAAGRYLHAAGAPDDIPGAIWMYNHDDEYVDAVMKYAAVMRSDARAFRGYYGWQVYFFTKAGMYLLPEGWSKSS